MLHLQPVDKTIEVVDKEHKETDDNREIGDILQCSQNPKDDQYHIVGCIGQSKIGAAPEGEIYGNEAGGNRKCAEKEVGSAKEFQNEKEESGNNCSKYKHKEDFPAF